MGYRLCSQSSGENLETVTEAGILREMLLPGLLCLLSSEPRDYHALGPPTSLISQGNAPTTV